MGQSAANSNEGDATISFIAKTAEFTPPVIFNREERAKLVFRVEALPSKPEALRVGQPISAVRRRGRQGGEAVTDIPAPGVMAGGIAGTAVPRIPPSDVVIEVEGLTKWFAGRVVVAVSP